MMKNIFSHAIIDTIDMFEDIYGEGGFIAINSDLKEITPESKNQKVVDHVSQEYKELLDYTQTIYPNREARYAKHDEEQVKWDNYFEEKYGNIEKENNLQNTDEADYLTDEITPYERRRRCRKQNPWRS